MDWHGGKWLILLAGLIYLGTTGVAYADPVPLESAYWRFEEGTDGTVVPAGADTVLDSLGHNHFERWTAPEPDPDLTAPMYTTEVAAAVIPQTGAANTLALRFTPHTGGGDDLFTTSRDGDKDGINFPSIANGFTLEATFKLNVVNAFQAIVSKEGQPNAGTPEQAPLQTAVLKARADNNLLQWEQWDEAGNVVQVSSVAPLVTGQWYHAAVVNDGSTLSLYLHGGGGYVLQGQVSVNGALFVNATSWTIGRGQYNGQPADWLDGIIDEVRLTNHALTVDEFLFSEGFAPGDFDHDNDIDFDDEVLLISCGTGPEVPYDPQDPPPGCTLTANVNDLLPADLDEDGDIDSTDFGLFQVLLDP